MIHPKPEINNAEIARQLKIVQASRGACPFPGTSCNSCLYLFPRWAKQMIDKNYIHYNTISKTWELNPHSATITRHPCSCLDKNYVVRKCRAFVKKHLPKEGDQA